MDFKLYTYGISILFVSKPGRASRNKSVNHGTFEDRQTLRYEDSTTGVVASQNGLLIMDNPIEKDALGVHLV